VSKSVSAAEKFTHSLSGRWKVL